MSEIIMPKMGDAMTEGKVVRWYKQPGDVVKKGEPLLEIETDKVTVEVESPADGKLASISAAEGEDVPVGHAVAVVVAADETAASIPAPQAPHPDQRALFDRGGIQKQSHPHRRRVNAGLHERHKLVPLEQRG